MIDASHFDDNSAYASVDRHQLQDFDPYIYRTRDLGKTWQRITNGLPAGVYVHVVKEDPKRRGMLVAGTERGAFISMDDGDHWEPLQHNLPVTSVRDFAFHDNDLIVATHGRGFWVLDDISSLRQTTPEILAAPAYLFKPTDITFERQGGDNGTPVQKDEPTAENPPNGVLIDYYLHNAASGPVTIDILDASGNVVHAFGTNVPEPAAGGRGGRGGIPNTSPLWREPPAPFATTAGVHRVVWTPVAAGRGRGFGRGGGEVMRGTFTARMTVGGQTYSQTFTVR